MDIKQEKEKEEEEEEPLANEEKKTSALNNGDNYQITKIDVNDGEIPQPIASQRRILPKHPFRWYIVGASGSGKSNLLLNLLTKDQFLKGYFDSIEIISPTALHLDPIYRNLDLQDDHFFLPYVEVLDQIMLEQEQRVKRLGKSKSPKILVILDDFISYKSFARSDELVKFAVMSRHWNISLILLSQAYHRVEKSVRLNMNVISYFKGTNPEMETLADDVGAPGLNKREFKRLINYATDEPYSFFYINMQEPPKGGRYRKNLTEVIY